MPLFARWVRIMVRLLLFFCTNTLIDYNQLGKDSNGYEEERIKGEGLRSIAYSYPDTHHDAVACNG